MKVPTPSIAFLAGGLLIGTALAPVAAQQMAPADGQVAVRSDGAVYLIQNGQRRWVATVVISDDELNAYPEGEPIYAGLAPIGSGATASTGGSTPRVSASPAAGAGGTSATGTPSASTTRTPSATAQATATTTATTGGSGSPGSDVHPDLPIDVDIEGPAKFEPGERMIVFVETKAGASCELSVTWPDGKQASEDQKTADGRGRCRYSIEVADNAAPGIGFLNGIVREGGKVSREQIDFEIVARN
jgi:hypothetical protein